MVVVVYCTSVIGFLRITGHVEEEPNLSRLCSCNSNIKQSNVQHALYQAVTFEYCFVALHIITEITPEIFSLGARIVPTASNIFKLRFHRPQV